MVDFRSCSASIFSLRLSSAPLCSLSLASERFVRQFLVVKLSPLSRRTGLPALRKNGKITRNKRNTRRNKSERRSRRRKKCDMCS
ncbi:unnamed protein product [Calypogeia fissa]